MTLRPRQARITRAGTAPELIPVAGERERDQDADFHYRLLSGQVHREKQARRALMSRTASARTPRGGALISSPLGDATEPLLESNVAALEAELKPQHSAVYRLLSGRSRHPWFVAFNRGLALLIVINVTAFVIESLPAFRDESSPYAPWFYALEAVSSCVFLLEYLARLWTIPESRFYRTRYQSPWRARIRYIFTIRSILDVASIVPFFVELFVPGQDLPTFTWIRSFRLFRILKSESSMHAFSSIYRVVWYNSEILSVALFIGLLLMMATSTLLWYLPPPDDVENDFTSIPATFYLSILMLTGQGTPEGDLPWYTKVIVMVTAVFSVPIFVIPASMLTWGFEAEAERLMRRKRAERRRMKEARRTGVAAASSSSSTAGSESETEWIEYENVILGEEGGEEGEGVSEGERALIKEVAEFFSRADADRSGQISLREFYEFQRENQRRQQMMELDRTSEAAPGGGGGQEERLERLERKIDQLSAAVAQLQAR